jgi:hypothetical protein
MSDTDIDYGDNEFEGDDEPGYADDYLQQDNETATKGAYHTKKKHGSTVDHTTVSANSLDTELLPTTTPEQEQVEVRRGKTAEDDEEKESDLRKDSAIVKQKNRERLAAASKGFDFNLLKPPKEAANDNVKQTVSWPLMEQLIRKAFEPDQERRAKNVVSVRYMRELIDIVEADSLGSSVHLPGKDTSTDFDVQRTESGCVYFEQGQTWDRRKATINNEDRDVRFIGSARTAKKSLPVGGGGFNSNHDDPFPVRLIAARKELDAIIATVGPVLWPSLKAAISGATMNDIGLALGAKRFQASREGTRIIRLALTAAIEALSRNEVKDKPRVTTPLPDRSRGSFYNQTRGLYSGSNHVVKVAPANDNERPEKSNRSAAA